MYVMTNAEFNYIWAILKGNTNDSAETREEYCKRYSYRVEDDGYTRVIIDHEKNLLWREDYQDKITVQELAPEGVEHERMKSIKEMTNDELGQFIELAQKELEGREEQEFNTLRDNIINAIREMQQKFPCASCTIIHDCDHDVNILDHDIKAVHFRK